MIVLGTILGNVVLELFVFGGIYYAFQFRRENRDFARVPLVTHSEALEESQTASYFPEPDTKVIPVLSDEPYISPYPAYCPEDSALIPLWGGLYDQPEVFSFINDYLDMNTFDRNKSIVLNSVEYEFIEKNETFSSYLSISPGSMIFNCNNPSFVGISIWFVRNITNINKSNLNFLFWTNEFYDRGNPNIHFYQFR